VSYFTRIPNAIHTEPTNHLYAEIEVVQTKPVLTEAVRIIMPDLGTPSPGVFFIFHRCLILTST
jgi:hypothetical protein